MNKKDKTAVIAKPNQLWEKFSPALVASVALHGTILAVLILALDYTFVPKDMTVVIPSSFASAQERE